MRASGGATGERSSYGPLANLLNAVGAALRPKVFCVGGLADQGAGHPDFGLYSARQVQRGRPREGQTPERGVVEVKPSHEDMSGLAVREQVGRYWTRYRLVLATNLREFALIGEGVAGEEAALETFRLAGSDAAFERKLQTPRAFAREVGTGLVESHCHRLSGFTLGVRPNQLHHELVALDPQVGLEAGLLAQQPDHARDSVSRHEASIRFRRAPNERTAVTSPTRSSPVRGRIPRGGKASPPTASPRSGRR